MSGLTLDTGGLIAIAQGLRITIPATAFAQAIRNPACQASLSRLIHQPGTDLIRLDGPDATAVGSLLAKTASADIVDAHVTVCAQRTHHAVVTSDARDLRRISPDLKLVQV